MSTPSDNEELGNISQGQKIEDESESENRIKVRLHGRTERNRQRQRQASHESEKLAEVARREARAAKHRRTKRSLSQSHVEPILQSVLEDLQDDMVSVDREDVVEGSSRDYSTLPLAASSLAALLNTSTTPTGWSYLSSSSGKVYTEQKDDWGRRKFVPLTASHSALKSSDSLNNDIRRRWAMRDIESYPDVQWVSVKWACLYHKLFTAVVLFCHGFLAGISFAQSCLIYVLSGYDDKILVHTVYSPVSQYFHAIFNFLVTMCLVSVFDRMDIGSPSSWSRLSTLSQQRIGVLSALTYTACIVVSLSATKLEDDISIRSGYGGSQRVNCSIQLSMSNDDEGDVVYNTEWLAFNYIRAGLAILGWMLISMSATSNTLRDLLNNMNMTMK